MCGVFVAPLFHLIGCHQLVCNAKVAHMTHVMLLSCSLACCTFLLNILCAHRCGRAADDISSIVLVEENTHYIKSDAILRIASRLGLPIPVIAAALMPLPHFIRDSFYDQVGRKEREREWCVLARPGCWLHIH